VRTVALYVAVGVAYVLAGVLVPDLLYASAIGAAWVLLGVWILPEAVRRLRSR
jgi:hypothetical protein